jgi:hypothetical protein
VRPFTHAHPVELVECGRHRRFDRGAEGCVRLHLLLPLADADRLGEPEDVARCERPDDQPALARAVERGRQCLDHRIVDFHVDNRLPPRLHADRELDPAAREPLLHECAQLRLYARKRRRHAQLHIEKPVVHGADGHPDGGRLLVARQRREPCHGFDHVTRPASAASASRR